MPRGLLAVVLHAHLPYVRHVDQPEPVEERWVYEALTDTYLPLVDLLLGLLEDRVPARLAVSLSPTLTAMLRDPLLGERYERYLAALRALAERQADRLAGGGFEAAARDQVERLGRAAGLWAACRGDLVSAFAALEEAGLVELMTSAASHGYLPLLQPAPRAVEAQVELGLHQHRVAIGRSPAGFWLPECGYAPGIDEVLARRGVAWTLLETHGIEHSVPAPASGVYAPLVTPAGLVVFGRDPECSRQVWSATEGYPADPAYREFYRDLGWELPAAELGELAPPEGVGPLPTGLKYCRVTGPTEDKEPYEPAAALARAAEHAAAFVEARRRQASRLARTMERPPVVVAPFDAELFGHWWFEGPAFLDAVLRALASRPDEVELVTPGDVLGRWPEAQQASPSASSWGDGGYSEVWLCPETAWVHEQVQLATRWLSAAVIGNPAAEGLTRRALDQAARELLLGQASDWTYLIRCGTARGYAEGRARRHLEAVVGLLEAVERGVVDETLVRRLERDTPIFPWMDYRLYGSVEARGEPGRALGGGGRGKRSEPGEGAGLGEEVGEGCSPVC